MNWTLQKGGHCHEAQQGAFHLNAYPNGMWMVCHSDAGELSSGRKGDLFEAQDAAQMKLKQIKMIVDQAAKSEPPKPEEKITDYMMREQMFATFVALEHSAKSFTANMSPSEYKRRKIPPKAVVEDSAPALRQESYEDICVALDRHTKALAIIARFGLFEDLIFGPKAAERIAELAGFRACSCVGTGSEGHGERCSVCGGRGYDKV